MKKIGIIICWSILFLSCSTNYETDNQLSSDMDVDELTIMFYNTENLYDTFDDPLTRDEDFTPSGYKNWTEDRYYTKLDRLAEVVDELDKDDWPAVIGLAEVENKFVLEDLIKHSSIADAGYDIVHFDSPDARGIDLGFLYRKEYLNVKKTDNIRLSFPFNKAIRTRDILYVEAEFFNKETIHFFINHWPSRREGAEETEEKRVYVASVLRDHIDEVIAKDENAKIVVMGDFNDYPYNKSIKEVLKATMGETDLYNLATQLDNDGKGSINYQGDWGMIDQMMISKNLFDEKGLYVKKNKLDLFYRDWLVYKDKKYGDFKPDKTYGGNTYYGGYSDHLPISIRLHLED